MTDDIFDFSYFSNEKNIEFRNKIEYPTANDNNSFIYIYKSKFSTNELIIKINEQFEIIPSKDKKKKKISNKMLTKKRGRVPRKNGKKHRKDIHNRTCPCNIRTKITIAYISFLVQFINSCIEFILSEEDNINQYKIKKIFHSKNITINFIKELKHKTIKDIILNKFNSIHLSNKKNNNEKICETIISKNKELEIILNQNYMEFFDVFQNSKKEVNLKKYGINKILFLNSNVVLYKDFINNIKNKGGNDLDNYLINIGKIVQEYLKI